MRLFSQNCNPIQQKNIIKKSHFQLLNNKKTVKLRSINCPILLLACCQLCLSHFSQTTIQWKFCYSIFMLFHCYFIVIIYIVGWIWNSLLRISRFMSVTTTTGNCSWIYNQLFYWKDWTKYLIWQRVNKWKFCTSLSFS